MDRLTYETGRAVLSTQGRDEGRTFLLLSDEQDGYVLMADGLTRKLDHPKKKKIKHLKPKPVRMETLKSRMEAGQLLDSDLRKFLKENGLGIEQPLCKED